MRDERRRTLKIELLSQWKLETEFHNYEIICLCWCIGLLRMEDKRLGGEGLND